MNGLYLADEALEYCLVRFSDKVKKVLDVGSGEGLHAKQFREHNKEVVTLDASEHWGKPDILGSLEQSLGRVHSKGPYDLVWCSHVLEHQRNVGRFLECLHLVMREGDILAITVPPPKHEIVGGHVSIWNTGLLLYNLVLAGFDCSKASCKAYGYNISVVLEKKTITDLQKLGLHMDSGDIEKLSRYFPLEAKQGFRGDIVRLQW
jgi:SAM-dependent methyltransferase